MTLLLNAIVRAGVAIFGMVLLVPASFLFYLLGYSFEIPNASPYIVPVIFLMAAVGILLVVKSLRRNWKDAVLLTCIPTAMFVVGVITDHVRFPR